MQVRLPIDVSAVVTVLAQKGGIFPEHAGRSAVQVATALIKESPTFQRAKKQIASERNPRPGVGVRTG